jgi:hypothetical protein
MAATTPILGIRYPVDTDNPNTLAVQTAIQNMANDLDAFFGTWTAWTPQVDQGATTNIAKTINVARYHLIGKFYEFEFRLAITGTGTASNKVTVTLPVTSKFAGLLPVGWGSIKDVSATQEYTRTLMLDAGSSTKMVWQNVSDFLGGPGGGFTAAIASGDILTGNGFGEVA